MDKKPCGSCGAMALELTTKDLANTYKGETITVAHVRGWHCHECGECEFFDEAEADRFASETAKAMAAIDANMAKEIRAIRKRLGLKRAEAAKIFGGGVNAFSEYERGIRKPSTAMVLLMKLLSHHPELLQEIKAT